MSLNFGYSEPEQKSSTAVDTTKFLQKTGGTMEWNLDLGGNEINKLDHPVDSKDGADKMYVDKQIDFPQSLIQHTIQQLILGQWLLVGVLLEQRWMMH